MDIRIYELQKKKSLKNDTSYMYHAAKVVIFAY